VRLKGDKNLKTKKQIDRLSYPNKTEKQKIVVNF